MTRPYERDQSRLKDTLCVKVYDRDHPYKKKLVGLAKIPLTKYMLNEGKTFDEWVPLEKRNLFGSQPTQSQIRLQFVYRIHENNHRK